MMWGRRRENGVWIAKAHRLRVLCGGDRIIYVAVGRFRLRLMRPDRT